MVKGVVIASGTRTASGRFLGGLSSLSAPDLGAVVVSETVKRAGVEPKIVDEVIMGSVVQAGLGQSPARQASVKAGIPPEVPSFTVNKVCGSALKAIMLADQAIRLGEAQAVVAGGMESMSNCPYILNKIREGVKFGNQTLIDSLVHDGLWCAFENVHMGNLAEFTAKNSGITREEQDEYAYHSQRKAGEAMSAGKFKDEIVPVEIPQRRGEPLIVEVDETPRPDTTLEKLAGLRPAFQKDGTVTAGNAPGLNDGSSAVLVMSEEKANQLGVKPMARVVGYSVAFREPKYLFYAPIDAVKKVLKKTGLTLDQIDIIEANEAFAAQCLADGKGLEWDWDRVNVNGGAIALGHPIGASGARVVVTLMYEMEKRGASKGLATLCLGGGGAVAMVIERV
jgi:acetyl-CoA C-acetyltransferase